MKIVNLILVSIFLLCALSAQEKQYPEIVEKLGEVVSLDKIHFFDENGQEKSLKEFSNGKPIVIALAFYKCTSICMPFINGVGEYVDSNSNEIQPGKDFELLTISFNASENFEMASAKKKNQFEAMKNKRPFESWRFLTGTQENINALTDKVGFKFVPYEDEEGEMAYLHKSALIVLSPNGKIVRYIEGDPRVGKNTHFNYFTMELAVAEAFKGISGPSYAKFLNVCFKYEPKNKQYTLKVLQIAGALITFCALLLFLSVTVLSKKPKVVNDPLKKEGSEK